MSPTVFVLVDFLWEIRQKSGETEKQKEDLKDKSKEESSTKSLDFPISKSSLKVPTKPSNLLQKTPRIYRKHLKIDQKTTKNLHWFLIQHFFLENCWELPPDLAKSCFFGEYLILFGIFDFFLRTFFGIFHLFFLGFFGISALSPHTTLSGIKFQLFPPDFPMLEPPNPSHFLELNPAQPQVLGWGQIPNPRREEKAEI